MSSSRLSSARVSSPFASCWTTPRLNSVLKIRRTSAFWGKSLMRGPSSVSRIAPVSSSIGEQTNKLTSTLQSKGAPLVVVYRTGPYRYSLHRYLTGRASTVTRSAVADPRKPGGPVEDGSPRCDHAGPLDAQRRSQRDLRARLSAPMVEGWRTPKYAVLLRSSARMSLGRRQSGRGTAWKTAQTRRAASDE